MMENSEEELNKNQEDKIPQSKDEKNNVDEDDFKGYSKPAKYKLFLLFFCLGIINHLGTILVMTGGRLLSYELGMKDYVPLYISSSTIFSIITRIINSKLFLKVSYKKRIYFLCFWMMIGYLLMFIVLSLHESILLEFNALSFVLSFFPCFFLGSSYAFGEAAMIAYLRLFPKTLIAGWSSGTGFSSIISAFLNFASQLNGGLSLKYLYLVLTPCGLIYLFLFMLTFRILNSKEKHNEAEDYFPAIQLIENENEVNKVK